jgi:hypothetical protein
LTAAEAPWGAAWRNKAQAALAIAAGVITAIASLVLVYFYSRDAGLISAYRSANICTSAEAALNGQICRYQGPARVVSTARHDRLEAVVSFNSLSGRTFSTSFPNDAEPDSAALKAGASADAELWDTKVTRLAGKPTVDDPEPYPTTPLLAMAAILGLVSVAILVLAVRLARTAWRRTT